MDPATIIAFIGALGIGGAVTQGIKWISGRRKGTADAAKIITDAAGGIVKTMRQEVDDARAEAASARREAQEARTASRQAERHAEEAEERARRAAAKFDRIWPIVERAGLWEENAVRVLIAERGSWTDPPLREILGQQ